ncbi:hypothetical protein HNQ77_004898 [Silvibacterium bohemicum]|uniref:DUF2489 domain-containing protein n=1 Tax=Silvibacterium bohemicum TaxID=1577686 RepID=A0A841K2W3_9BACT|nr:hypothetical protein [Silvibacterium bohemicum]MBB6146917.1 hypothetical protein [Silvibacterium bohemicum]
MTFTMLQIIVPALVALIVVSLSHFFTSHRDQVNRRREQRIEYLVTVFRALSKANNHPRLYEVADDVEQAVADIQLFGTPEQVRLVQEFATALGTKHEAELNPLLISLRDDLRSDLGAQSIPQRLIWLRIARKNETRES